jgi:hypothetical protein
MMKKLILIAFSLFLLSNISSAQFFNKFSLFGGPMIGWQVPNVSDLNREVQINSIPEFSKSGFLTFGGGGYIDVPGVNGLRVGGFGTGFSDDKIAPNDPTFGHPLYASKFSFRYAAISIEYARKLSKHFEYTLGENIGVGKTQLDLIYFDPIVINWNTNEGMSLFTYSHTSAYTTTTYTFNPQVGLGYNLTKFMYLKLNAGYMFTLRGDWKLNDVLPVSNVPSGIKADGFNFNLGINFGLFAD